MHIERRLVNTMSLLEEQSLNSTVHSCQTKHAESKEYKKKFAMPLLRRLVNKSYIAVNCGIIIYRQETKEADYFYVLNNITQMTEEKKYIRLLGEFLKYTIEHSFINLPGYGTPEAISTLDIPKSFVDMNELIDYIRELLTLNQ